ASRQGGSRQGRHRALCSRKRTRHTVSLSLAERPADLEELMWLGSGLRRAEKGGGPLSPSVPPDKSDAHRDGSDRGKGPSVRREAEEGGRFERLISVADEVRGPDRRRAVVGLGPGIVPRDRSEEGN